MENSRPIASMDTSNTQMEKNEGCINEGKVMIFHGPIDKENDTSIKWKSIHVYLYNDRVVYHDAAVEVLLFEMEKIEEILSTDAYIFQVKLCDEVLSFQVSSELEKDEWIGCLQLAKAMQNMPAMMTSRPHKRSGPATETTTTTIDHVEETEGFFRFASSDSDDCDEDSSSYTSKTSSSTSSMTTETTTATISASSGTLSSSLMRRLHIHKQREGSNVSPKRDPLMTLLIIQVIAKDPSGNIAKASIPLTLSATQKWSVRHLKIDVVQQLRTAILELASSSSSSSTISDTNSTTLSKSLPKASFVASLPPKSAPSLKAASHGLFDELLRKDSDYFVLKLEDTLRSSTTVTSTNSTIWLKDEQKKVNYYLGRCTTGGTSKPNSGRSDDPSSGSIVHLEIVPMNQMPSPGLEVSIPTTKIKLSDISQKPYTVYVIEVSFNEMKWEVPRRFKEFHKLHLQLKKRFDQLALHSSSMVFPRLPRKQMLFTPTAGEFVLKRRIQLEEYLIQVLSIPQIADDVLLMSFLGVVSTSRDKEIAKHELNVVHVTSLHLALNYGDIILFSCRFGASVMQRKFTGAKYDHVGIVVPGPSRNLLRIMEATGEGIQVYSLKARLMAYSREVSKKIVVRTLQVERTQELEDRFNEFVSRVEGNGYSIMGILQTRSDSEPRGIDKVSSENTSKTTATSVPFGDLNIIMAATANTLPPAASISDSTETGTTIPAKRKSSTGNLFRTSPSSSCTGTEEEENEETEKKDKRKYFCSSLVASTLKHVGWLQTKHSSSYFWPGSFEEGGEIEKYLRKDIQISPEQAIDCRIVEVGLAIMQ